MDINGFQDRAFDGTSFTVRNAGNLRHQGFEFDGVAKPMRNLSLFASLAYLDSEFTDYPERGRILPGAAAARRILEGQLPAHLRAEVERTRRLRLDRRHRLERITAGT